MVKNIKMIIKTKLAKAVNLSRSALYYENKQPEKDAEVACEIKLELMKHKTYGHRRIAVAIERGKNSTLRIMKKFGLEPISRKRKKLRKKGDENTPDVGFPNLLESMEIDRPDRAWAEDFTCLNFHGSFVYLATVIDVFTREILGFAVSRRHNAELVMEAVKEALSSGRKPEIDHSDQGSEYRDKTRLALLEKAGIRVSMSRKASPWENPYKEGFYSQFKLDLGDVNRFQTLGELIEEIGQKVRDYNTSRIHSVFNMPPQEFREQFLIKQSIFNPQRSLQKVSHLVS